MERSEYMHEKVLTGLLKITDYCCWFIIATMALVVSVEVVGRYALNASLNVAEEIASFGLVCFIFLSLPGTFREQGFLRVDLIHSALPEAIKRALAVMFHIVALIVTSIYVLYLGRLTLDSITKGTRSDMALAIPNFWPQIAMVVGVGLLAFVILARLVQSILTVRSGDADNV
jgi:TRAP-type C4-dicarboxylate transport system permease small subunit